MNYIDANIKQLTRIHIRPLPKEQYEPLNYHLKKDILDAGDAIGSRTAAKCIRTHWKMHEKYESFKLLCDSAIDFANKLCETDRYLRQTDENGVVQKMKFTTDKSWGLIYKKGDDTATHTHFPALWSWTYCVLVVNFVLLLCSVTQKLNLKLDNSFSFQVGCNMEFQHILVTMTEL